MLSLLQVVNHKGEVVISRQFRDDITRSTAEVFGSKVVATKETGSLPPVKIIDGASFLYTRHSNLYRLMRCEALLATQALPATADFNTTIEQTRVHYLSFFMITEGAIHGSALSK